MPLIRTYLLNIPLTLLMATLRTKPSTLELLEDKTNPDHSRPHGASLGLILSQMISFENSGFRAGINTYFSQRLGMKLLQAL